jgi:hypothetical protein
MEIGISTNLTLILFRNNELHKYYFRNVFMYGKVISSVTFPARLQRILTSASIVRLSRFIYMLIINPYFRYTPKMQSPLYSLAS